MVVRRWIGHGRGERPGDARSGCATSTALVVERTLHRRGERFRHRLLHGKLTDVRRESPLVAMPSLALFRRVVAELVDARIRDAEQRSVQKIVDVAMRARARVSPHTSLCVYIAARTGRDHHPGDHQGAGARSAATLRQMWRET